MSSGSTLKEKINHAFLLYLQKHYPKLNAVKVTDFYEVISGNGCGTCDYGAVSIDIYFVDDEGNNGMHYFLSSFSDIINELSRLSEENNV